MAGTPAPVRSVSETVSAIAEGSMRCADAVEASLSRIAALDGQINAFTQVFADEARQRAESLDRRIAAGERPADIGPLLGLPIAVKDNICTTVGRTTCASRFLENYRSPFDAHVVEQLERAGAIVVGKTNLDEFAMGSSGEHSYFGPTKNPRAPSRGPGGSSSGSAAAVAAGMVAASLGSDTGGSIRQPAALCGVVGIKPTYGAVSRYGLVAFASSLDQVGPIAANTRDTAMIFDVIAGHDPRDSTSTATSKQPAPNSTADIFRATDSTSINAAGMRIGIPNELLSGAVIGAVDAGVLRAFRNAEAALRSAGATTNDVRLEHSSCGVSAYYLISSAEASSNLARFDGVRFGRRADIGPNESVETLMTRSRTEGFGPEVRRRIMLGTHALSSGYYDAYYMTALRARRLIRNDFDEAFQHCDAILMPTTVRPAFRIGEKLDDPVSMYLEDVFTVSVNLAGLPAIGVPAGWCDINDNNDMNSKSSERLPIGVQLIGPMGSEATLVRLAAALEHALKQTQTDA